MSHFRAPSLPYLGATRWQCVECGTISRGEDLLFADNPFDQEGAPIVGCPKCLAVSKLKEICDEHGCKALAVCGFESSDGYRHTCYAHYLERKGSGDE